VRAARWGEWTRWSGYKLRSAARCGVARLVLQMRRVAKQGGYITIFDDEVDA
jgi:hypothetical protein